MNDMLARFFGGLPAEWLVVVVAALPVSELRGAIPLGVMMNLAPLKVIMLSIAGNLLPVLPLLYFLEPVSARLRKAGIFKIFFDWLFERTKKKSGLIEKYELLGLMLFVAVPLPMTGAWTGCIAASLFGLNKKLSFFAVAGGVVIAALVVSIITLGAKGCFSHV
ncbi:MAG: small multi-drug export protein [Candidatus Omnitrophica bacterium]|nr:small multi-drug export protein [Candidatus Omnitrophota bacterium]MCG2703990.1 small multi-drug export protein [Candidatus Omnitrophota bacterium]